MIVVAEGGRRSLHRLRRRGTTCSARDVVRHRLSLHALVFLGQPADEGISGGAGHSAFQRCELTREDAQQRRLSRAVGAEYPDHVAWSDRQIEVIEQHAMGISTSDVLGDERGCHASHGPIHGAVHCRGVVLQLSAT